MTPRKRRHKHRRMLTMTRTDGLDLTKPVSGLLSLRVRCANGQPLTQNVIVATVDGAVVGDYRPVHTMAWLVTGYASGPYYGRYMQLDLQIDTSQLGNGPHFAFFTAFCDADKSAIEQLRVDFIVDNVLPPVYSGKVTRVNPPPAGTYPHFGRDGSILQTYDPARSVMPIGFFPTGQGGPTPADLTSMGLTMVSLGAFLNPNDYDGWRAYGDGDTIPDKWKQFVDGVTSAVFRPFDSFIVHTTWDALCRNAAEQEMAANCPWYSAAVAYTASIMGSNFILADMVDEVTGILGMTPYQTSYPTGFWEGHQYTLPPHFVPEIVSILREKCPDMNITWPVNAIWNEEFQGTIDKNWNDAGVSDFGDIYYTTLSYAPPYYYRDSLFDQSLWSEHFQNIFFTNTDTTRPWIATTPAASETPTYPLSTSGKVAAGMLLYNFLIQGCAGARIYSWNPAFPNWSEVTAAIALVVPWLTSQIGDIFQPMVDPPYLGPWLATGRRDNSLAILNLSDVPQQVNYDNSEVFGAGVTLLRWMVSGDAIVSGDTTSGPEDLILAPNQAVVYVVD